MVTEMTFEVSPRKCIEVTHWKRRGRVFQSNEDRCERREYGAYGIWGRVALMNLGRWMGPCYKRPFKTCFKEFVLI